MDNGIKKFYDLNAWKSGHKLVLDIYNITEHFPSNEMYGITSQLRRACSSVTANIAEGFARYHFKDKIRFYYHARGSVAEVQNFLFLARDVGYVDTDTCRSLCEKGDDVAKLVNGLIRSIEKNNK